MLHCLESIVIEDSNKERLEPENPEVDEETRKRK